MFKLLKLDKKINIEGIYTFFYFEHSRNYHFEGERHNFWEMVYVDSGELSAVSEDKRFTLSQGNVIFHKPMEFHGITSVNNKPHNVFIITFETKSPAMDFFKNKIFSVTTKEKRILSEILNTFQKIFGDEYFSHEEVALDDKKALSYQMGISHLEHFLLELMEDSPVKEKTKKNVENSLVSSVKSYLNENLYETILLDDICTRFNIGKSHLCRLFKEETGTGIINYFIDLKIKEAKLLIREGNMNFTQIAEKLGYNSLQHFTRIFKRKVKMSPGLYEKSIK